MTSYSPNSRVMTSYSPIIHVMTSYSPSVHVMASCSPIIHVMTLYSPIIHVMTSYSPSIHVMTSYSPSFHEETCVSDVVAGGSLTHCVPSAVVGVFVHQVNSLCEDDVICDMEELHTTCDEHDGTLTSVSTTRPLFSIPVLLLLVIAVCI